MDPNRSSIAKSQLLSVAPWLLEISTELRFALSTLIFTWMKLDIISHFERHISMLDLDPKKLRA